MHTVKTLIILVYFSVILQHIFGSTVAVKKRTRLQTHEIRKGGVLPRHLVLVDETNRTSRQTTIRISCICLLISSFLPLSRICRMDSMLLKFKNWFTVVQVAGSFNSRCPAGPILSGPQVRETFTALSRTMHFYFNYLMVN